MTMLDAIYLALLAVGFLGDHFVVWRAFLRRSDADPAAARAYLWSRWMVLLWTLAMAGVALWVFDARAWEPLRMTVPGGWRLSASIVLVFGLMIACARRILKIARSARTRRVRMANPDVLRLIPQSIPELRSWVALSVTAGVCEEFVFRGYLLWVFQPALGLWGAAALSIVLFGMVHAYQGVRGACVAGALGAVFTVVVLASGSLLPAIVMHTTVDIGEGVVAWLVMRKRGGPAAQLDRFDRHSLATAFRVARSLDNTGRPASDA